MKKVLLTLLAAALCFSSMAQDKIALTSQSRSGIVSSKSMNGPKDDNPSWSQIHTPFTTTDINGNAVNVADTLAAGKAIVIDYSATWCNPCYRFHQSKNLEAIHNQLGSQVCVLWVEADNSTTLADIMGTGSNTQGDWTHYSDGAAVSYPIIDCASCESMIDPTGYVPAVYFVAPSGYYCHIYGESWGLTIDMTNAQAVANIQALMSQAPQAGVAPTSVAINGPNVGFVGQEYGFEVSYVSIDDITGISWTFEGGNPSTETGSTASTTWNTPGTYTITVEVSNTTGMTAATKTITIRDGWTFGDEMDYTDGTDFVTSIGYGGNGEIAWGIKYPASVVANHNYLTSVSAYINDGSTGQYDVRIYEGSSASNSTLVYEAPFDVTVSGAWHTFTLPGGVVIDQSKDLWVTLHCNGVNYPAAMTDFCGDPNSQLIEYQGVWQPITELADFNYSWMIKAMTSHDRPAFDFELSGPTSFKSGETKDFSITGPADATYSWTLQGATPATATGTTVSASWANPGNYTISVQGTLDGSTVTKTLNVTIIDGSISLPFTETFENDLNYWTTVDADGDGYTWSIAGFEGHSSSNAVGSASFINNIGVLTPDNWLISNQFTSPAGGVTIEWWEYGVDANDYADNYSVYVSPNGGGNTSDFSNMIFNGCPQAPKTWVKHSRHIATTGNIRVAFRHHDVTNMYWLLIDDVKITAGNTSGIDNLNTANVDFYPNPVNDKLYISEEVLEVSVVDVNGRVVMNANNTRVVDMSNLSNGIYFVRVITDNGTATKKIVKK